MTVTLERAPINGRETPLRILLVEDSLATRQLLRTIFESDDSFVVVGEAVDGHMAIESATALHPDVVLLDLSLPDTDGADVLPHLLTASPGTKVVVLSKRSARIEPHLIELGAVGFIAKGLAPKVLLARLSAVLGLTESNESPTSTAPMPQIPSIVAPSRSALGHISEVDPVVAGATSGGPATSATQLGLDALVTEVAVEMMSISAESVADSLEWILRKMNEHFEIDTSFLRRHDRERDVSVLLAEWPKRQDIPDPDPLGEVPFGSDPVFDATRDLKEPFIARPTDAHDPYQERVEQASGIGGVSVVIVPLIRDRTTVGVLGFVKFGDRSWDPSETNALQAVASLLVHVQARVDAEEQLRHEAHHDELTGLANRRSLLEVLTRRLENGRAERLGLLVLDFDRFKGLNDFLGHEAGDQFLKVIADRLRHGVDTADFICRLAGDEFVVLLERDSIEQEASSLAELLLNLVSEAVNIDGHAISRTASVGLAFGHSEYSTPDDLLAEADAALYVSKGRGGNRQVAFDNALRETVTHRLEIELQLRQAIHEGGLLLHYQPEVDLRTGALLAVEALVRWNHPQRGLIAAGEFIPIAEETGLIADLGVWVLAEACRQIAAWRVEYPDLHISMRVNMSPAQLVMRNIVDVVQNRLEVNNVPGSLLCLEITEHAVVQDKLQAIRVLNELRTLGVTLAIDDFGTGYSSIAQLKQLPVDTLKLDQTFVTGLGKDPKDRAIVDTTIRLANSFGLAVVAEGVETPEVIAELLDLGCYRAQGYLLCKPAAPADLAEILIRGQIDLPAVRTEEAVRSPRHAAR